MTTTKTPYYNSKPAQLIRDHLIGQADTTAAEQIGRDLGYNTGKIVIMMAEGELKVPLDKALPLARVLQVDPAQFSQLSSRQIGGLLLGQHAARRSNGMISRTLASCARLPNGLSRPVTAKLQRGECLGLRAARHG